jgi:trypsin
MKFAVVLSALVALVVASPEIVGGEGAKIRHRYVAGLKTTRLGWNKCGGSLIAPNVILTAAHCTGSWLKVAVVGSHKLSGKHDGELVTIVRQIVHPQYNPRTMSNDVAILLLDRDITNIEPVEVSFDRVGAYVLTMVRGWGTTIANGIRSQVLKEVRVASWDNAKAQAIGLPLDETMIASGGVKGQDSCQGDSGGPMTIEHNGTTKLVGVVSWGFDCALENSPGVYSRLDTAMNFIRPYLRTTYAP